MRFIFKQPNFELVENINLIIVYNPLFLNSLNLNSIKSFFYHFEIFSLSLGNFKQQKSYITFHNFS